LDLCSIEGNRVVGELEAFLDEGSEFADAASLLSENLLCMCGANDDIGDCRGNADLDTRVTLFGEFTLEEFVELGVENTVCEDSC